MPGIDESALGVEMASEAGAVARGFGEAPERLGAGAGRPIRGEVRVARAAGEGRHG